MKISYRRLVSAEAKQYRAIRLESLKLHPESFGSTFAQQSKLPKLMFEKAIEAPPDERFVLGAFDYHDLIGICGFVPANDYDLSNAGTIIQMYVKSAYSGRKIGLNLVKATIQEAFKLPGIEQIVLGVAAGNMPAIRVYEQAGFQTYIPEGHKTEVNQDGARVMIIQRNQAISLG